MLLNCNFLRRSSCPERNWLIFLCFSFASASFSSRKSSSLSVDSSDSKVYTISRVCLIAAPYGRLPQKRCIKLDLRLRLYRQSSFFLIVLFPLFLVLSMPDLPCCRFLKKYSFRHQIVSALTSGFSSSLAKQTLSPGPVRGPVTQVLHFMFWTPLLLMSPSFLSIYPFPNCRAL